MNLEHLLDLSIMQLLFTSIEFPVWTFDNV